MADTRVDVALSILLKVREIFRSLESTTQVELDVVFAGRRGTTVLMPASPDGNGLFLGFGVCDDKFDVFFVVGLNNQAGVHVVVVLVGGSGILVARLGVVD
jgi:hypothetical protein